jgi:hypothetical protein
MVAWPEGAVNCSVMRSWLTKGTGRELTQLLALLRPHSSADHRVGRYLSEWLYAVGLGMPASS